MAKNSVTRNLEETLLSIAKQAYDLEEQANAIEKQECGVRGARRLLIDEYQKKIAQLAAQKMQFKTGDYVIVEVSAQKRVGIVIKANIKVPDLNDRRSYWIVGQGRKQRSRKEYVDRIASDIGQAVAGFMSVESMSWIRYEVALIRPNGYAEVNTSEYSQAQLAPYTGDFVTVVPKVAKLQV